MKLNDVKKVGIGTTNPVKIQAVKNVFKKLGLDNIDFVSFKAPSGVSDQPIGIEETIKGAYNRAKFCLDQDSSIDIAFGLEGSVDFIKIDGKERCFLSGRTVAIDRDGIVGYGGGGHVELPEFIGNELKNGKELGPVMDEFLGEKGIKHKMGTVGILTGGLITRTKAFEYQVIFSLAKWISDLYK